MIRRDMAQAALADEARRRARAFTVVLSILLCVPCIAIPVEALARQLPEEDRIRLAAFEHLVTTLFPADTTGSAVHCFSLRDETDFEAPPQGPGRDPASPLMAGIRRFLPDARVVSECPETEAEPDAAARGGNVSPVIYSVGALTQAGSTIKAPVSYRVNGLNGGGWACWATLRSAGWQVVDCLPTWISAPD
jgi:hypothetical protein